MGWILGTVEPLVDVKGGCMLRPGFETHLPATGWWKGDQEGHTEPALPQLPGAEMVRGYSVKGHVGKPRWKGMGEGTNWKAECGIRGGRAVWGDMRYQPLFS